MKKSPKNYDLFSDLTSHLKKHGNLDELSRCDECDFKCLRSGDLSKHKKKIHAKKFSISCGKCNFQTTEAKVSKLLSSIENRITKISRHV